MPGTETTIRRHLAEYHHLLDNEEGRLRALLALSGGINHEQIVGRIEQLAQARQRLEQTLKAIAVQPAESVPLRL